MHVLPAAIVIMLLLKMLLWLLLWLMMAMLFFRGDSLGDGTMNRRLGDEDRHDHDDTDSFLNTDRS